MLVQPQPAATVCEFDLVPHTIRSSKRAQTLDPNPPAGSSHEPLDLNLDLEYAHVRIDDWTRRASSARNGSIMILAPRGLDDGIAALGGEPVFAAILERAGAPRFRRRANGFPTLLHIILEQQVSIDAAAAMHRRLAETCRPLAPEPFLALDEATLKRCGFSRRKISYARGLAEAVASRRLDFAALALMPDDEARATLVALKGIGRWSAEVYLIFALGRPDIWPAADLGLQLAIMECLGLPERPREKDVRDIGERWRPWRSVASCLFWQSYLHARNRAAPVLAPELYADAEL